MTFTKDQIRALDLIENGHNVFITGPAGTGKTFLISEICSQSVKKGKNFRLVAPTGIAAVSAGNEHTRGRTLHSFLRITPDTKTFDDYLQTNYTRNKFWKCLQMVIMDEISMVHPDILKLFDRIARFHRKNDRPFGGIQIVLVGDLYQLPFVPDKDLSNQEMIFETDLWNKLGLETVVLSEIMRQTDSQFIDALCDIRLGTFSERVKNLVHECSERTKDPSKHYVKLHSLNILKDNENTRKLNQLKEPLHTFEAVDQGLVKLLSGCRAEKTIHLKKGAPVMLLWNEPELDLFNGSIGRIVEFEKSTQFPIVKFNNGVEIPIEPREWKISERDQYGRMTVVARRKQLPLALAWALSIHKTQSLSLDYVEVDCAKIFATGQLYVALSRARTKQGLIISNFDESHLMVNEKVDDFYCKLTKKSKGTYTLTEYFIGKIQTSIAQLSV